MRASQQNCEERWLFFGAEVEGIGGGAVEEAGPAVGVELGGYEGDYLGGEDALAGGIGETGGGLDVFGQL